MIAQSALQCCEAARRGGSSTASGRHLQNARGHLSLLQ